MTARHILFALLVLFSTGTQAADWSNTEFHFLYGRLDAPSFAGGATSTTRILTLQHASAWRYGSHFFFVDYLSDSNNDGFNEGDWYGEIYSDLSLGKLSDTKLSLGPISDISLVAGFNAAAQAKVRKWLPGMRLALKLPGFAFFNLDFTAYIDDSFGVASGGAPKEDDSWMVNMAFAAPFDVGSQSFSVEGFAEYIGERDNAFGNKVTGWFLTQTQLRYDIGKALFDTKGQVFVGAEWQIWSNKLGDATTDENALQALLVWEL